ncbi:hypothetical protein [Bradyrhizobium sp. 170]|uniref:hypothetical protein n=1 Tax=Bradyrhizobium sp. 170 TaxID=2782641 RepID=UPI003211D7B4
MLDILIVTGLLPLLDSKTILLWSERVLVVLPNEHPLTARAPRLLDVPARRDGAAKPYDPGREFEDLLVSKLVSPEDRPKIV